MIRLTFAVDRLCHAGLGLEAQILARTMYDNYLQLKFLEHSVNIDETATEYIFWDMANDVDKDEKILEMCPELKSKIENANKDFITFKRRFSHKDWMKFVFYGPSFLSPKKLSKHIDELENSKALSKIYEIFYHETSGQAHGYDFLDYAKWLTRADMGVRLSPVEEKIEYVLITVLNFLTNTCIIVNNKLSLGKNKTVEKMDRTYKSALMSLPAMALIFWLLQLMA
jgi:hypothetical protein